MALAVLFRRPASRPKAERPLQSPSHRPLPSRRAERAHMPNAVAEFVKFARRLDGVDVLSPVLRCRHGPRRESWRPRTTTRRAAPRPVRRPASKAGDDRIPLDITTHDQEMEVVLHGDGFVASLIDRARADRSVMPMPAAGMSARGPRHELGQFLVMFRPYDQVPVIGHQHVTQKPEWHTRLRFPQSHQKQPVVLVGLKERQPPRSTIHHVKHESTGRPSRSSRHRISSSLAADDARATPRGEAAGFSCRIRTSRSWRHPTCGQNLPRARRDDSAKTEIYPDPRSPPDPAIVTTAERGEDPASARGQHAATCVGDSRRPGPSCPARGAAQRPFRSRPRDGRLLGRAAETAERRDAAHGGSAGDPRHRHADGAAREDRRQRRVRLTGSRRRDAAHARHDLPHLLDEQADHRRGDDDAVRRGQVAGRGSAVEVHPGIRGPQGLWRDSRRRHAHPQGAGTSADRRAS